MDNVTNGKRTTSPVGNETRGSSMDPNQTSGSVEPISPEYVVTVTPSHPTDSPSDWMGQNFTTFVVSVTVGGVFFLLVGVVILLLCRRYGWWCRWSSGRRKAKYESSQPCSKDDGQADGRGRLKKHAHTRTPTASAEQRTEQKEGVEFSGDLNTSPYLPRSDPEERSAGIVDMVIDPDGDFDVEMISRDFSIGIPHVRFGSGGGGVPQSMVHPSSHLHRQNTSVQRVPYITHASTATPALQAEEEQGATISNDLYGDVSGNYYSPEELEGLNNEHGTSEGNHHNKVTGLCGPVERDDDVPLRLASLDPSGVFQSTSFILSLPSGTTAANPIATLLEEEEGPCVRRDAPPPPLRSTEQQRQQNNTSPNSNLNAAPNAYGNGVAVSWSSNVGAFLTASKIRAARRQGMANGTHEHSAEGEGEEQTPAAGMTKNSNSSIVIVVDDGGDEAQQPQQPIPSSVVARRPPQTTKPVPHNRSSKGYDDTNNTNRTSRTCRSNLGDMDAYSDKEEEVRSVGSDEADVYHKGNVLLPSYLFANNNNNTDTTTNTTNGKEASYYQRERKEKNEREKPLCGNWGDRGGEPFVESRRSQNKRSAGAQHQKEEEEKRGKDEFAKSSTSYNKPLPHRSLVTSSPSGSSSSVSLYGPRYNEPPYQNHVAIETAIDVSPPEKHSEGVRGASAAGEAAVTMANKGLAVSPTNRVASWAREQALRGAIE